MRHDKQFTYFISPPKNRLCPTLTSTNNKQQFPVSSSVGQNSHLLTWFSIPGILMESIVK
jgi:hypothetical protein